MDSIIYSRREFIARLSFIGLLPLSPCNLQGVSGKKYDNSYLEALMRVMDEQARLFINEPLSSNRMESMTYAYSSIHPSKHLEMAIVAWAGLKNKVLVKEVVDEYCRRRNGEVPKSFLNPPIDKSEYVIPETYGLYIFREQITALLNAITNTSGDLVRRGLETQRIRTSEDFSKLINSKYLSLLNERYIEQLYEEILFWVFSAAPYLYFSAMVDRADRLALGEKAFTVQHEY